MNGERIPSGSHVDGAVRRRVTIRSGNRHTAAEVMRVLATIPPDARMNAQFIPGSDPHVVFWWDEQIDQLP